MSYPTIWFVEILAVYQLQVRRVAQTKWLHENKSFLNKNFFFEKDQSQRKIPVNTFYRFANTF